MTQVFKRAVACLAGLLVPAGMLLGCGADTGVQATGASACPPTLPTVNPSSPARNADAIAAKPTPVPTATPRKKPTTTVSGTPATTPAATASTASTPTAAPVKVDAAAFATKILNQLADAPGYDAIVTKEEIGKKDGKSYTTKLHIIGKHGNRVKLDVLQHFKPQNTGVKLGWALGASSVTVRPAGTLSFLTANLPASDAQIVSPNGYAPTKCELYALAARFMDPMYKFELIGKTTVGSTEVHILKVVCTGTNSFDPDIQYEYLGFDPSNNQVMLWEFYGADATHPIHRVTLESFKVRDDVTDAELKV